VLALNLLFFLFFFFFKSASQYSLSYFKFGHLIDMFVTHVVQLQLLGNRIAVNGRLSDRGTEREREWDSQTEFNGTSHAPPAKMSAI